MIVVTRSSSLPASTLRLFDGLSAGQLARPSSLDFVIERLLEAGDAKDLRWLVGAAGEPALQDVVRRRGQRGLSTRSRRFWRLLLDGQLDAEPPAHAELWPL